MNFLSSIKQASEMSDANSVAQESESYDQVHDQLHGQAHDQAHDYQPIVGADEKFMAQAIKLAARGINTTHPNPMVGCVIVNHGKVVGTGWHEYAGGPHAEVNALKMAGKSAKGATMYVTLEPCSHQGRTPPCTKSIIKSGVSRVVIAMEDPNPLVNRSGITELRHANMDVVTGIGRSEARILNRGFLKRIETGFPWVTLKIATSLDGKTAMHSGESHWITSEAARQDAHKLRAASSGILTGVGTVLRDNPSMTARIDNVSRQPTRIILDTHLSTPVDAKILDGHSDTLIFCGVSHDMVAEHIDSKFAEVIPCACKGGRINPEDVLRELGKREMNSILVEAGSVLSGSMLAAGLVDEVVVYMAPDLLGSDARDMFKIPGLETLSEKIRLEYKDMVMVGRDLRIILSLVESSE